MTDNNCIFGLAAGYHFGDVRPFLFSLKHVGYQGDVILFVSPTTRNLDQMREHGATVIPFDRPDDMAHIPYNAYRYFLYLEHLKAAGKEYAHIFLADVRDVVFQLNPFDYAWSEGMNCTLEDLRMTLGSCPHNSHWIRGHQGDEVLASVSDQPISCSGTSVGDHAGVVNYLEVLTERLLPFDDGERMAGYDQGVHNVMVHNGALPDVLLHDNSGPIMTLGYSKGEPEVDAEGFVLNESGERAHVVHQYDRKPELFKIIRQRYA